MGELVYIGTGGGSLPVATAVLNDLIGLYHPSRSWTGRYPRAPRPLERPRSAASSRSGVRACITGRPPRTPCRSTIRTAQMRSRSNVFWPRLF
jgi:hypothetical protein